MPFRRRLLTLFAAICLFHIGARAADPPAVKSGPEVGKDLPGPFRPYNVTGKEAGNYHCVICPQGLDPLVLVFVRNSGLGKEADQNSKLLQLLADLNSVATKEVKARVSVAAVFLFDDLKDVVKNDELRKGYVEKLSAFQTDKINDVTLCLESAEGPKAYGLNPDAKVTILVCSKLRVLANFAYADEAAINTEGVLAAVKEKLGSGKK
jgi:hypothetical protein